MAKIKDGHIYTFQNQTNNNSFKDCFLNIDDNGNVVITSDKDKGAEWKARLISGNFTFQTQTTNAAFNDCFLNIDGSGKVVLSENADPGAHWFAGIPSSNPPGITDVITLQNKTTNNAAFLDCYLSINSSGKVILLDDEEHESHWKFVEVGQI